MYIFMYIIWHSQDNITKVLFMLLNDGSNVLTSSHSKNYILVLCVLCMYVHMYEIESVVNALSHFPVLFYSFLFFCSVQLYCKKNQKTTPKLLAIGMNGLCLVVLNPRFKKSW